MGLQIAYSAALVAPGAPGLQPLYLVALGPRRRRVDQTVPRRQRRGISVGERIDADDDLLGLLDRLEPRGVALNQLLLEIAALDRLHRAAHRVDRRQFRASLGLELFDLGFDFLRAVEQIAELQQVGLVGHDLLQS